MKEIKELKQISRKISAWRYVQAGGGNTSVKAGNTLYIKASGVRLSDINETSGYVAVDNKIILNILNSKKDSNISELLNKGIRPSIEIYLHAILSKYVIHTHDVSVNIFTCRKNWREDLRKIFIDDDILFISYATPGIELGIVLKETISKCDNTPNIIFLQNHGLIVHADSLEDVLALHKYVNRKCWSCIKKNVEQFELINYERNLEFIIELGENRFQDIRIKNIFSNLLNREAFSPDVLVYTHNKYFTDKQNIIIKAYSKQQAMDIAELIAFKLVVLYFNSNQEINYLSTDECAKLLNWDAEKYRVNLSRLHLSN